MRINLEKNHTKLTSFHVHVHQKIKFRLIFTKTSLHHNYWNESINMDTLRVIQYHKEGLDILDRWHVVNKKSAEKVKLKDNPNSASRHRPFPYPILTRSTNRMLGLIYSRFKRLSYIVLVRYRFFTRLSNCGGSKLHAKDAQLVQEDMQT